MPTIARTTAPASRESGEASLSRQSILRGALHGRILSLDFMRRNWLLVLAVTAMLMIYITSRYTCQTQMETIQHLEHDLEVVKTERIREKSTYMSRIRESQMQHMADSMHLGVTIQEQPPFRLSLDKD